MIYYIAFLTLAIVIITGIFVVFYFYSYNIFRNNEIKIVERIAHETSIISAQYFQKCSGLVREGAQKIQSDPSVTDASGLIENQDLVSFVFIHQEEIGKYYYFEGEKRIDVPLIEANYYANGAFRGTPTQKCEGNTFYFSVPVFEGDTIIGVAEGRFLPASLCSSLSEIADGRKAFILTSHYKIACVTDNQTDAAQLSELLSKAAYPKGGSYNEIVTNIEEQKEFFSYYFSTPTNKSQYIAFSKLEGEENWYAVSYTNLDRINKLYGNVIISALALLVIVLMMFSALIAILYRFMSASIRKEKNEVQELSLLTENIPCGVFAFTRDPAYTLISTGEGFLRMLGYTAEELEAACSNSLWSLIFQPDRIGFAQTLDARLQPGTTVETEFRLTKKDGTLFWVRCGSKLTRKDNVEAFYAVVLDITEAKNYTEQLATTNDDLKQIMDVIPGGVARLAVNDNFEIHMANASFYQLCGYTPDEFRIQHNGGMLKIIDNRDREKLFRIIASANVDGDPIITEFRIIRKDGKTMWLSMHAQKRFVTNDERELLCVFTDISSLREAYNQAKLDREKARKLAAMATHVIFEYDVKTDTLQFIGNKLMDYPQTIPSLRKRLESSTSFSENPLGLIDKFIRKVFENGMIEGEEIPLEGHTTKEHRWYTLHAYAITDSASPIIIGKLVDITERKKMMDALIEANKRDPLTNLYNHQSTKYYVEKFLQQPDSASRTRLQAFLMLDIDNFKHFNDILGHATGDAVLKEVSETISKLLRSGDIFGRVGGDEFVILLKNFPSVAKIKDKAAEICDQFANTYFGDKKHNIKISVSIGISIFDRDGKTYSELFEKADKALYAVKSRGKNGFALYSEL
jgi:diguanylate cyclase (GGDEF)-like protein/PAS domain S-box-containing protein